MTTLTDTMTWRVETSHLIHHPDAFAVDSMAELRRRIQSLADARSTSERSFGELSYRYELDDSRDEAVVMHCYFDNRHNKRQRFMRLRRDLSDA